MGISNYNPTARKNLPTPQPVTDLNPVNAMTADYHAMCAELTDAELANAARKALGEPSYATELHYFLSEDSNEYEPLMLAIRAGIAADRARALLAQPVAEGPTDEEIMELMPQQMRDDLAAAARALSGFDPDNIKAAAFFRIILNRHAVDHALAVLAKWGNHPESPDSSTQPS